MADGIGSYLAGKWLNWLNGSAETAPSALYVQLHTGDPGSAGTSNVSSVTTRKLLTATVTGDVLAASGTLPSWTSWAGTNGEEDTDLSLWDASTGGDFLDSIQLEEPVTMYTSDTLDLSALSVTVADAS